MITMTDSQQTRAAWYQQPDGTYRYFDGAQWAEETVATPPTGAPTMPLAQQQATPVSRQIISDSKGKPIQASLAWIIALCTLGYMVPWAIAATRGKSNAGAIGWINLLAGWTVIGWIVALAMACGAHQKFLVQ